MQSAETMGVTGDLYTSGPYAYTRNPQYVGMIVGVTGFALLADSAPVATLAAVHVGWVLLLPRAEEPHLRAEFGDAYDRYATRVPRFVGLRTVRRAVSSVERVNSRGATLTPWTRTGPFGSTTRRFAGVNRSIPTSPSATTS
ncbi:methyltransferase family protein [Haloplanus litoreus]|uniref:methyltransferase family protein n=1 Tax=Haloplanus litoreus TaxID=767515 RepID=UPI00360C943C